MAKPLFKKNINLVFLYYEQGQYSLNNTDISFHQENTFELTYTQLIIYNHAAEILHNIELSNFLQMPFILKNTHKCNKDTYNLAFIVEAPLKFTTEHIISGPQKDHKIVTNYSKYS
jgi:hypothetical protein